MPIFLMPVLGWLGNLLGGPFATAAVGAYKAKLEAGNTSEKLAADLAARDLEVQQRQAELNNAVLIAEQGRWYTACIRPLFALPFIIYNFKLIVWDKVLGLGITDPLSKDLIELEGKLVIFYLGGRSVEKVGKSAVAAIPAIIAMLKRKS